MYDIYKSARNMSWECLIRCAVNELPVRPVAVAKVYGVVCRFADSNALQGSTGLLRATDSKPCIFVDSSQPAQRQRYTIAHELGHYLLGHLDGVPASEEREYAAERFAADLLMPACVLWGLSVHTAEEIAELCNVSMRAAQIRAERMEVLYQRNKFLLHPLERKVYAQFGNFIQNNKQS